MLGTNPWFKKPRAIGEKVDRFRMVLKVGSGGKFEKSVIGHNAESELDLMSNARIITGYIPGIVGRVTELHAMYYHVHWGFGAFFEAKVASEMSEFISRYDESRDRIWCATVDDRIEASITIDGIHAEDIGAHLRWFITSDAVRGEGLGGRLIKEAMRFCRDKRYSRVYLWTFRGLESARHLYEKAGFSLVETRLGTQWGTQVNEQRYEVSLTDDA